MKMEIVNEDNLRREVESIVKPEEKQKQEIRELAEQNTNKNFPILEDGKVVDEVSCANALTYEESEDGSISVYSLQIYFNIKKEG